MRDPEAHERAHDVFDPIAQRLQSRPDVDMGPMFGVEGLRVRGKVFACIGYDADLMLKLPRERVDALESAGLARRVVMRERAMKEWAYVDASHAELWEGLVAEALAFVDDITP
ncbi:hypothetical protein [Microbacterium aurum]|uniref:hypothetical protein n=1 Tax=Microbacterium aurum TaxID=36805 RepID=UPI0028E19A6B|nr:hypothetical protein [Microbacterium aurum]